MPLNVASSFIGSALPQDDLANSLNIMSCENDHEPHIPIPCLPRYPVMEDTFWKG